MTVITISRQYASGGDEIAVRVCEMLDYRYFDKRLMAEVVSQVNLPPDDIVDYSEDHYKRTLLDRLQGWTSVRTLNEAGFWKPGAGRGKTEEMAAMEENMAVGLVHAAIDAVWEKGDAVIVGRGGQAVLQNKPGVLHVRIEAPLELRVRHTVERDNIKHADPRKLVLGRDRAAADYVKRFYGSHWADPTLYHLVINTGKWDVESAAHLVASAASCVPAHSLFE